MFDWLRAWFVRRYHGTPEHALVISHYRRTGLDTCDGNARCSCGLWSMGGVGFAGSIFDGGRWNFLDHAECAHRDHCKRIARELAALGLALDTPWWVVYDLAVEHGNRELMWLFTPFGWPDNKEMR